MILGGFVVFVLLLVTSTASEGADLSRTCKFTTGPKTGQTQRFPTAQPIPVGSPCWDGGPNSGVAVAEE